jgi:cbb3-type cytochrome oxidase subunit 3
LEVFVCERDTLFKTKFVGGMHVSVWLHGPVVPVPVPVPSHLDGWVSFGLFSFILDFFFFFFFFLFFVGFWLSILDRKKVNHTSKEARK